MPVPAVFFLSIDDTSKFKSNLFTLPSKFHFKWVSFSVTYSREDEVGVNNGDKGGREEEGGG